MSANYRLQKFRGGWAICQYKDGRRTSRKQLQGRSAESAAREYSLILAELKKPKDPKVTDIWELYREDRKGRQIAKNMDWSGRSVLPYFGEKRPSEVTTESCRGYADIRRKQGRKDGTIWTELGHLRGALKWAENKTIISRAPPIERPPKPSPKDRYLTREEFDRLQDAAIMPHMRLFLLLALSTAGRVGALLDLTWDRVDLERGVIYLGNPDFKGQRKGRATVPITNSLRPALLHAKEGARSPYVIEWTGGRVGSVKKGVQNAAKRAGLRGISPHVLRHTAAVWMAEGRVPMQEIAQYLGHSDDRITQRVYARFSPEHLRGASDALEVRSAPRVRVNP